MFTQQRLLGKVILFSLLAVFVSHPALSSLAADEPFEIGVGVLSNCVMMNAVEAYDREHSVFQKVAKELGIDINVKWRVFPYAPDAISAAIAGDVQFITLASYPLNSAIAKGEKFYPLNLSEHGTAFYLLVRKNGEIKNFEDLKGKVVSVPLGTEQQGILENFLKATLGGTSEELGITLMNMPIVAGNIPRGVDAIMQFSVAAIQALKIGEVEILVDMANAVTGPAYEGPLGKGAGIPIPAVKDSIFYPGGFSEFRHFYVTYGDFSEKHPNVVLAWLVAYQQIVEQLCQMSPEEIVELYPEEYWDWDAIPRDEYEKILANDGIYKRGWIWPTASDVKIVSKASELMVETDVLDRPLSPADVINQFGPNLELLQKAYEYSGSFPPFGELLKEEGYFEGPPVWELDEVYWQE